MRVPNSPHSLRKVMATGKSSSSEGEDSDGTAALGGGGSADSGINFRPPRPKRNKSRDDNAFAASMNIDGDRRFDLPAFRTFCTVNRSDRELPSRISASSIHPSFGPSSSNVGCS